MGKRLPSAKNLEEFARVATEGIRRAKHAKRALRSLASNKEAAARASAEGPRPAVQSMENGEREERRVPLSEVVSDCVRRWFQDALREAKNGDAAMQVLVGQMYHSGYGCPRNEQKGKAWIAKASKYRSAVWKVSDKHPGYNASDSDTDEVKDDVK
ncbi:uncharacterized protein LOC103702077 isoform X2 [Phoenix dactylifera]|uniref:Uncharacterized protein LOC103702077 isoform X2 n=1 Tax=Phoenix dactylifera TaxID=42345 RepID=A0A8B7BP71_PHODC|nr:uncharacterized protein LOC103702077 isoform X2 [Phoenix dactylifera]